MVDSGTDEALDELVVAYDASIRQIMSLPELPMRRAALGSVIANQDPREAVWWIDQLIRGTLWGRTGEVDAMLACSDWLIRERLEDDYALLQTLFEAAVEDERESVLALLRDPPPHRALAEGGKLPEVRLPLEREVTLGERRSLARGQDRKILERLLMDPSPIVLDKLLDNPQLRTADIISVASRRPTTPDLLLEVAKKPRWLREQTVREALVHNPYSPTGLALKLLPTLGIKLIRRIRNSQDLHPAVHSAAKMFVELRENRTAPWRV